MAAGGLFERVGMCRCHTCSMIKFMSASSTVTCTLAFQTAFQSDVVERYQFLSHLCAYTSDDALVLKDVYQ
jgi:GTP cyclohydrolase I